MPLNIEQNYGNIHLVEIRANNHPDELLATVPGQKICVCDFYVAGCENGRFDPSLAAHYASMLVIDHHAPEKRFMRQISSTTIANQYVKQNGPLPGEYAILINHTDTDSLLSAMIMNGMLAPEEQFHQAAIAADHTGEENIISDILQALEENRDIRLSIDILRKVLDKRLNARDELKALVNEGRVKWDGDFAYLQIDKKIDAALARPLLPKAKAYLVVSPMPSGSPKKWRVRARLGMAAKGIKFPANKMDDFGGRWNAISTTREGGTNTEPQDIIQKIRRLLNQQERKL